MITLQYVNSQQKTFQFLASSVSRVKTANFHKYAWKYSGLERQFGVNVSSFQKDPYEYEVELCVKGTMEQRKTFLNSFHEAAAYDVINLTPGKLWWNDFYLECYITETSTYPSEDDFTTVNDILVFAPYPFWIQTKTTNFYKVSSTYAADDGLDFPFDFPFDFAGETSGYSTFNADHYVPCDFELIVYGPAVSPRVLINGHPYQVFTTLASTEYMILNSKNKTVYKNTNTGTQTNIYNSRQMFPSVFDKIPGSAVPVIWDGSFGFTLTAYKERGEPEWT